MGGSDHAAVGAQVWPLIQPPSGSGEESYAAAMSSGVPSRSSGAILAMRSMSSGDLPLRNRSVAVGPGAMALTVTCGRAAPWRGCASSLRRRPWSPRRPRRSASSRPTTLVEKLMIRAAGANVLGRLAHGVEAALEVDVDHAIERGSSVSAMFDSDMTPALLTSTSMPPKAATVSANKRRTSSGLLTRPCRRQRVHRRR